MRVLLIQPPFTQLNAPYPAVHCLDRYLRNRGYETEAQDHSIGLYRRLMTAGSVRRIFDDAEAALAGKRAPDAESRRQVARYFSYRDRYAAWAEPLTRLLSAGDAALAFRLSRIPDDLPIGLRAERFLEERDGTLRPEEAPSLAIRILDDLGDFIAYALDPGFGTVRYAERIASSRAEYAPVSEAAETGYLMGAFYRPWLRAVFGDRAKTEAPDLLLLSAPFPGCLVGAVAAAREARRAFGAGLRIALGGGYVSTELRSLGDGAVFDDFDRLCFDAGYGALASLIEGMEAERRGVPAGAPYRTALRGADGAPVYSGFPLSPAEDADPSDLRVRHEPCPDAERFHDLEEKALRTVFPDYRGADMTAYLRAPSSDNPMHRIWSDAVWLKYQLAYGCYWHRCAFCDTQLDYVRHYLPSDPASLMAAADEAQKRTGLSGIHFTDEALPLPGLLEFARLNRARENPFSFWGNVRFDRVWTEDRCALLASSGLIAVSGGIEIATERGLAMTGKGFTFPDLVRALAAFQRSGILTHAYLIYGFPEQTDQDLVDSAEAVRQLFATGLLDSAFWHRFVLTRHSEMYARWRAGELPSLKPVGRPGSFASNDLDFRGSERWDPYDGPLETLLAAWMAGNGLDRPVRPLRPGGPRPSLAPDWVEGLARAAQTPAPASDPPAGRARVHWIAGLPSIERPDSARAPRGTASPAAKADGAVRLEWTDRGEPEGLTLPGRAARRLADALVELARNPDGLPLSEFIDRAGLPGALEEASERPERDSDRSVFLALRESGLVVA